MNTELNAPRLTDQALFLPAFLLFASLLIGLYLVTAPPGGNVVQAMFTTSAPVAGGSWVKMALLGG
ncbi:hypothetical protein [Bradyrhizobium prioriisuperbiae]|uniref:hypothetical protein n=1 Tax=Bradyrhizobium prioriisuperbiae TaxID=2854389 RepID=UPI0028E622BE|nr:hypothetical protein [Bradyrhizobium prioritasuperba]